MWLMYHKLVGVVLISTTVSQYYSIKVHGFVLGGKPDWKCSTWTDGGDEATLGTDR